MSAFPKSAIYLINLNRSPERLAFMTRQLKDINLDFQKIEAVDGSKLAKQVLIKHQQKSKQSLLHYAQLNYGEIGCAMSWHKAWNIIANQQNKACVVLEDDVKLNTNFLITINALLETIDEDIIIDLSGKKGFLTRETKTIANIKLIHYQTPPLKIQGQIYGKKACQIFLDRIQHFKAPVDTLQQMIWLHGIQTWSLEVGCLSHQDNEVGGSTITPKKKKLLTKINRELMRPLWRGFIIIRNILEPS